MSLSQTSIPLQAVNLTIANGLDVTNDGNRTDACLTVM